MTMEPPCRVIEGIVAEIQGKSPSDRGLSTSVSPSVAAIILTIQGEPGPWGSPPSTVPMRSPETEQTFAVASGRTKSAWPGPAFVVFVSRPSSPSLCPCPLFPSTTLCGNTASLWRWAGMDGSDLSFPFVEAFPSGLREKRGFVSRVGSETGLRAPTGRSSCRVQLRQQACRRSWKGLFHDRKRPRDRLEAMSALL